MNSAPQPNNTQLIREWVYAYWDELFQWAYYKTNKKELAEDLVQETFLAAQEKIDGFKKDSQAKTWLFSILRHKILDYYRSVYKANKKEQSVSLQDTTKFFDHESTWLSSELPGEWEQESHLLDQPEFNKVLKKCLDALPEKWGSVVALKYLSEKKASVICQELNISTTNYWQMIHRAKLNLRKCIENKWF